MNSPAVSTRKARASRPHRYRLDNSPFYAYGLSWLDVVEAHPDEQGQLAFARIVEKSGHRTVRIIFDPGIDEDPEGQAVVDELVRLGCSYEGAHAGYIAVDLPPAVDLMRVARHLTEQGVQWEHADPRYSDLYPERGSG